MRRDREEERDEERDEEREDEEEEGERLEDDLRLLGKTETRSQERLRGGNLV